jgi:hypothetical protein
VIADLRRDCDAWRDQAERLALATSAPHRTSSEAAPQPAQLAGQLSRLRRAWRWMRTTG